MNNLARTDGDIAPVCSPDEARELTDRIKVAVDATWQLVKQAYEHRAWSALGYASWDDYCTREFGSQRLRLPREERREVVGSLREAGLSIRAIAAATGDSVGTVHEAIGAGVQKRTPGHEPAPKPEPLKVTGIDGKTYSRSKTPSPKTPPRKPLTDAFFTATYDLGKVAERLARLTEDDRFTRNADQVAARNYNDLIRAQDLLQEVINQLADAKDS